MRVYLDNCCYNRPFDDQSQIRIALEAQANLFIQRLVGEQEFELVWSYVSTHENENNPFVSKKTSIRNFSQNAGVVVIENETILSDANRYQRVTIKKLDALHLACAKDGGVDFFITTDDRLLKCKTSDVNIINPVNFVIAWTRGDLYD
jgi:predicted nucleic acid-binding protein